MKKLAFFKFILFISIIGLIIFSLLFVLYIYDITQKNKTSENLASSLSIFNIPITKFFFSSGTSLEFCKIAV